jgi:hypothetical protein
MYIIPQMKFPVQLLSDIHFTDKYCYVSDDYRQGLHW